MDQELIERLKSALRRFGQKRVAVVGDLILDEFIWGSVDRISPEAPVPVVAVKRESVRLGGAANVASNLLSLGAEPLLVGVVGDDSAGLRFLETLKSEGIGTTGIVVDSGRQTTIKTRIIAHHQQVCRADRESRSPLSAQIRQQLMNEALRSIAESHAVVLSDYSKGVLTCPHVTELIDHARRCRKFVAVDPKVQDFSFYKGASIITPNTKEAERAAARLIEDETSLLEVGRSIIRSANVENLLVTRGSEGMTLFQGESSHHIDTVAQEVFDVTGAGDTVIAALTLGIAAGASLYEAALLANHAAGVVVGKLGTASATPEEILESIKNNHQ